MNIEIQGLSKIYPNGHAAIRDVNLQIGSGMFGLLGPNGAGKSSLMRILVTLQKATGGSVHMDGMDINTRRNEIRPLIGYLPQDFTFFSKLKTWEFLDYAAQLSTTLGRKQRLIEVDHMLDQVGLLDVRERLCQQTLGWYEATTGYCAGIDRQSRIAGDRRTDDRTRPRGAYPVSKYSL